MAVSITLVLTSIIYLLVAAIQCRRILGLLPGRSKAPYSLILSLGLLIQLITYVLIFLNLVFLAFLPRRRRVPLLATVAASLFQSLPLILLICSLRALHARLGALTAAQPAGKRQLLKWIQPFNWFLLLLLSVVWILLSLWSHTLTDALNGRRLEHSNEGHRNPLVVRLLELSHALIFVSLTWIILSLSRTMNGFLLLPDKVLLALSSRITPFFLLRASYTLIDTALPLLFRNPIIRVLTPSLAFSADGLVWLIIFYNLYNLCHPPENWIDQGAAHLVHGVHPVAIPEDTSSPTTQTNNAGGNMESSGGQANTWSRLLSSFTSQRRYGATNDEERGRTNLHIEGPESPPSPRSPMPTGKNPQTPDVAIVHGVAASGTQLYAQTGPMAPAWLLQDTVNGQAGDVVHTDENTPDRKSVV